MGAEAAAVAAPPVVLELDLDVFDGPFDLLITLILKDEIDIWEVRVSRIIAEYVLKLADSGEFDLDATSQFVVLVAALLEMKSRLLLEEEVEEEIADLDPDEAAERLLERLVRYSQFKNLAGALRLRWEEHSARLYRSVPVPPALLRRATPAGALPASALPAALAPLLRDPPVPDTSHLADLAVSLVKELRRLRLILGDEGEFTFSAVAPDDRLERAVTFFALLELHSGGEAVLRQKRHLGDIVVSAHDAPGAGRRRRSLIRAPGDAGRLSAVASTAPGHPRTLDLMHALARRLEALLFISSRPLPPAEMAAACGCSTAEVDEALAALRADYTAERHGITLRDVAGGVTFAVADDCAEDVRRLTGAERPDDLTPALLETLAVVAYLQPVTRAEAAEVRGVSSEWALSSLEERGLVEQQGRADTPGAPILYCTGARFLKLFGLRSLQELPPLEEFSLQAAEVDAIRARLLANAERRRA